MKTIHIPQILLPESADMHLWAVNACDQFTSDYSYWSELEKLVGQNLSTLKLVFPEIYLKDNPSVRIDNINKTMRSYLNSGVFKKLGEGFILVERTTSAGTRTGLVIAIDLEDYSFEKGATTPVRSTEATILERIPPRVAIRRNALLELPHIMLLYDDKQNTVLNNAVKGETLYDFDLNMNGGHIKGTAVNNSEEVVKSFYRLVEGESNPFLFAVGDGNHSLATAKACWEEIKKTLPESQFQTCPARYALCEAVNIHDSALNFEPIHRFVKTDKVNEFKSGLKIAGTATAVFVANGMEEVIAFDGDTPSGIRKLDEYIASFIKENGGEVDYIHGQTELKELTKEGGAGVILPAIPKDDFFALIKKGGNLPRKTFSMGEGNEKRYYIESRIIR
ncbi:MAG: DUF1015 domain-containing protein [Clostridia bacterium]|nr:DUF1015 domain-containing protein [Clostridia bacterium]